MRIFFFFFTTTPPPPSGEAGGEAQVQRLVSSPKSGPPRPEAHIRSPCRSLQPPRPRHQTERDGPRPNFPFPGVVPRLDFVRKMRVELRIMVLTLAAATAADPRCESELVLFMIIMHSLIKQISFYVSRVRFFFPDSLFDFI